MATNARTQIRDLTRSVWIVPAVYRAELKSFRDSSYLRVLLDPRTSTTSLPEVLGTEYDVNLHILSVAPVGREQPWNLIFSSGRYLAPEILFWIDRDLVAVGSDDSVAALRLSSGKLLFADRCNFAFYSFVAAEDFNRIVAVGETRLLGIDPDGLSWEFETGEVIENWHREGRDLIIELFGFRRSRVDIVTGKLLT